MITYFNILLQNYDMNQEIYSPDSDDEYLPDQELLKQSKRRYQKHKQKKCKFVKLITYVLSQNKCKYFANKIKN